MASIKDRQSWITLIFPLNLIAPYGMMGLEYRVPTSALTSVEICNTVFSGFVRLVIAPPNALKIAGLDLRLKSPETFLAALRR